MLIVLIIKVNILLWENIWLTVRNQMLVLLWSGMLLELRLLMGYVWIHGYFSIFYWNHCRKSCWFKLNFLSYRSLDWGGILILFERWSMIIIIVIVNIVHQQISNGYWTLTWKSLLLFRFIQTKCLANLIFFFRPTLLSHPIKDFPFSNAIVVLDPDMVE